MWAEHIKRAQDGEVMLSDFPTWIHATRCVKCNEEFGSHRDWDWEGPDGESVCDGFENDEFGKEVEEMRRDQKRMG